MTGAFDSRKSTMVLGLLALACHLTLSCSRSPAGTQLENGSFFAELNGFRIHYEVHGSGPILMTLPNSWGLSLQGLRGLYRGLETELTLVYFDPRGMGLSAPIRQESDMGMEAVREDFDALRRHMRLDKVHVIGWSNGATNLVYLSSQRPQTLRSAVFLHGGASFTTQDQKRLVEEHPDLIPVYEAFAKEIGALSEEEWDERTKRFNIESAFPFLFKDREAGRSMLRVLYRDTEFSKRHADYTNREPFYDATALLPAARVPSLVVAGAHDLLPPQKIREVHEGLPDSRFVVFAESAHFSPLEEPQRFMSTVVAFVLSQE